MTLVAIKSDDARWNRTQYRYNANDQIVETQYSNQFERQSEKFQYDNNLNITEHQFIPPDAQGAFLQLAQQQQKGRVTRRITAKGYQDYHYDINGRLTQKVVHQHGFRAKTWYYQWNTLNQLIACFNPEGECWRYTYDAFGRRLSKSKVVDNRPITPPNSPFKNKRVQRVDYLWSGDQMVQETPIYADGTPAYDPQIQWLYQPGEITPTARYQRGKLHYVVTDHQGTPREIFSEKGIVSWAGRLNTWGQMAFWQSNDDYADNDPEYTECHFRFAGQYEDKESGLYYNRFRYYDKDTGQYISPDPIGLLGGFNPYGYVHCPTGWVDPFGLSGTSKLDGSSGEDKTRFLIDSKGQVLDIEYFRNLKFNGQILDAGRGGGKLPMMGEPATYSKTTGGHIIIFGPDGRRIADISKERIKIVEWNRSPKGQYFIRTGSDTKFAGREIPNEIKKLWGLE
ncbi:hypothetical protein GWI68_11815 [Proteus sp. G2669]|nr:hypothetical protein [Proteus sp. G2669]